jgi:hypothetical protein
MLAKQNDIHKAPLLSKQRQRRFVLAHKIIAGAFLKVKEGHQQARLEMANGVGIRFRNLVWVITSPLSTQNQVPSVSHDGPLMEQLLAESERGALYWTQHFRFFTSNTEAALSQTFFSNLVAFNNRATIRAISRGIIERLRCTHIKNT